MLMLMAIGYGCTENPLEGWEPGQPIELDVGKKVKLSFDSDQSTGCAWQLKEPLDETIVKVTKSEYKPPEPEAEGASGKEFWTFKMVGSGETQVVVEYVCPGEETSPKKPQTFTFIVE